MALAGAMLAGCTVGTVDAIPVAPTPTVRRLTITPVGGATIVFGASVLFVSSGMSPGLGAFAEYSNGTGRYVEATWTSSKSSIVSVDNTALTARSRGTAIVTATFEGHSDDEQFEVIGGIAGNWAGTYVVQQCGGSTGSIIDVMCTAPGTGRQPGLAYVGATLPITMELTVSGDDVSGIVAFGNLRGTLTGKDRGAGSFYLQGTIEGVVTLTITYWDTLVQRDELQGFLNYHVRVSGVSGTGEAVTRLVNVTRR